MTQPKRGALLMLISAMVIFGTVGVVRRMIPLDSAVIASVRGVMGAAFLIPVMLLLRKRPDWRVLRSALPWLILTGMLIGLNWVLLFEAYHYTTVAIATLCYYMQPVIVMLVSPVLLHEKLTRRKLICTAVALIGMGLVTGLPSGSGASPESWKGILLGLGAAVLYAGVIILNKRITGVGAYEKTIAQLATAGLVLLPYLAVTGKLTGITVPEHAVLPLLIIGLVHTGVAYVLYFSAVESLPGQTAAIFGYLDPIVAVLLSATFLGERMTPIGILGTLLVLGAMIVSCLPSRRA